jgi:hypothetical protein
LSSPCSPAADAALAERRAGDRRHGGGRPVVSLFLDGLQHQAVGIFFPLTISAGHEETVTDNGIYIPKKELVVAM